MPQKPLLKPGKKIAKKPAANKHGKAALTRKGHFAKPPKKGVEKDRYHENKELSKVINRNNEANFAAIAQNKGGRLKTLKGAKPPALATKDAAARAKAAKQPAAMEESSDDESD